MPTDVLFKNNAASTLALTVNIADTLVQVQAGHGTRFPSLGANQVFYATIQSGAALEIVKCTARAGDVLTVVRAQDGTTAQTWNPGSSIDLRIPNAVLENFLQKDAANALFAPINGPISLTANPTLSQHATRKSYVDNLIAGYNTTYNDLFQRVNLIGQVKEWSGMDLPSYHLWADGSAVSRTTYSALFEATTRALEVTMVSGSPTLNVTAGDTSRIDGMPISGPGIPAGALVSSGQGTATLTLSLNATVSQSGAAVRVCPYGVGDGSTTFNLIDRRGTVGMGRDNMGLSGVASRVTQGISGVDSVRLGCISGDQRVGNHGHTVNDPGHTHTGSTASAGAHTHTMFDQSGYTITNPGTTSTRFVNIAISINAGGALGTDSAGAHTHTITMDNAYTGLTINTGGGGGYQNIQPVTVTHFIIYSGVP